MGHVLKQQCLIFCVLIVEKPFSGTLFFPLSHLFSSTVIAAVEKNKKVFFSLLCNRSGLWRRLLHTLSQAESSESPLLAISKQHLGTSSFFVHGGLDFPHCFQWFIVHSGSVPPLMNMVLLMK